MLAGLVGAQGLEAFRVDNGRLFEAVVDCRVIKTEAELQVLRYNNLVSSEVQQRVCPCTMAATS